MEESWSLCLHTIFGFEGVLRGGGHWDHWGVGAPVGAHSSYTTDMN